MAASNTVDCEGCGTTVCYDDLLEAGGSLVCPNCSRVVETELVLDDAPLWLTDGTGPGVRRTDEQVDRGLTDDQIRRQRQLQEQLRAAGSSLNIPDPITAAAVAQLPTLQRLLADARMVLTEPALAAVLYLAARQAKHVVALGELAAAFNTTGLLVAAKYRQLLRLLQQNSEQAQDAAWSLPLADLQQWVLSSAARLLKPELAAAGHAGESPAGGEPEGGQEDRAAGTGALRAHPLVSATCQLLELLVLLEATDVGSPAVCAAALLSMVLAAQRGGRPATYAPWLHRVLGPCEAAQARHVRRYQAALERVHHLLPFLAPGPDLGQRMVGHVATVLKLHRMMMKAQAAASSTTAAAARGQASTGAPAAPSHTAARSSAPAGDTHRGTTSSSGENPQRQQEVDNSSKPLPAGSNKPSSSQHRPQQQASAATGHRPKRPAGHQQEVLHGDAADAAAAGTESPQRRTRSRVKR